MEWIATEFNNKTPLIQFLVRGVSSYTIKGYRIWCVENEELILKTFRKNENKWEYRTIKEKDLTIDHNTCPICYFDVTNVSNKPWREYILSLNTKKTNLKKDLKEALNKCKKDGTFLIVVTDSSKVKEVILENITPLVGRSKQGKLYQIPLRRIVSWRTEKNTFLD